MNRLRIPQQIAQEMRHSLGQPHSFAAERVGFVFAKVSNSDDGETLILATAFHSVPDDDYIDDPRVGARINSNAIRGAMQRVLDTGECAFHVHLHDHTGGTSPSYTDEQELKPIMRSIRNAAPQSAHGILILSQDAAWAEALFPNSTEFQLIDRISVVGFPCENLTSSSHFVGSDRFARQTFLGKTAAAKIAECHVGIVGLGGGGSHIVQQLAHVGFSVFSLFDNDQVETSNLNRLIGATLNDAEQCVSKVDVAARLITGIHPDAKVERIYSRWQNEARFLRACDIVFGCVDSFAERRDLEIATRRHLIPYIDIGLDVHEAGSEPPRMAGQVLLSMPGNLCMSCMGFLTEPKIAREVERYGAAGPRPQVVWSNGVLASTAVGIVVDLITDWTRSLRGPVYLSYDANTGCVEPHRRLQFLKSNNCSHFPLTQLGTPTFKQF